MRTLLAAVSLVITLIAYNAQAGADKVAEQSYTITIKDHKFSPENIEVPANTPMKLVVINQDTTPEEFESHDLKREKIVKGNSQVTVAVSPLKPGTYSFFGEFNPNTAKGTITVK